MGQEIKNYSSLNFLQENLEKFRSTELYDAPLEGSKVRVSQLVYIYIYIYIRKEGSQNKLQVENSPRRARVRAET